MKFILIPYRSISGDIDDLGNGPLEPVVNGVSTYTECDPVDATVVLNEGGVGVYVGDVSYFYAYMKIAEDAIRRHISKAAGDGI